MEGFSLMRKPHVLQMRVSLFYSRFTAYGNDTFFSIRSFSSESLLQREDVLAIDAFVAHLVHNLTDEEDAEAAYLALFG